MSLKEKTINHIIKVEGGYVDDPNDSGGETNWGITVKVARDYGYTRAMIDMPKEIAFDIYEEMYWASMELDEVEKYSALVAEEMADTGVNMGVGRASTFLQIALNALNNQGEYYADIAEDGDIGRGTLKALDAYQKKRGLEGMEVLAKALNGQQIAFYIDLTRRRQKDERFLYGWLKNRA